MAVSVYIPTPYRQFTGGAAEVSVEASTVGELLQRLAERYPPVGERVLSATGEVADHVNIYVNDVEIRSLQGRETPLKDGDEVALIPAMAGGTTAGGANDGVTGGD
ncbi:MAG: MoaD family protein, partial [Clostridia bacterium]|nr:MoaD family protein [Clostridia bacterium]